MMRVIAAAAILAVATAFRTNLRAGEHIKAEAEDAQIGVWSEIPGYTVITDHKCAGSWIEFWQGGSYAFYGQQDSLHHSDLSCYGDACWPSAAGSHQDLRNDSSVCPTSERLQNLQSLQVWAEGKVGDVKIDMKSVGAYGCKSVADLTVPAATVPLTTFDGVDETTQKWMAMNDPVMGGRSKATFTVANNVGVLDGAVAIVPSLQAPGFCTMQSPRGSFPDISGADAIQLVARQTSDYKGWRFTIGDAPRNPDSGAPFFVKGQYKANVQIPVSDEFQTVIIPFSDFTYKWSDTTGEPTVKCADDASVCPEAKYLQTPKQLAIMAEGLEGSFHLEVQSITAVNTANMHAVLV